MGVPAGLMVGGAIISAYGQLYSGQAAKQAGEYNAAMSERNAMLARQKAAEDERVFRTQTRRKMGEMRAAIGASGVTTEGSPFEVLEDSAAQAEMDALRIRYSGEMQATNFMADAQLQRYQGSASQTGSYFGAAGSLLGGLGHASGYGAKQSGSTNSEG
jgi:hypothetical protein